jgi:hypothetical protein
MPAQMHEPSGHAGLIKSLPSGHHNFSLQCKESAALSDFYGKTGLFLPLLSSPELKQRNFF